MRAVSTAEGLKISVCEGDLLANIRAASAASWDVVLCLRDTLCLLETFEDVGRLLAEAARVLEPSGLLVVSYRDSTELTATGVNRFLEVARDQVRILHCLIEPLDPQHLRVTDILTEVGASGPTTRISDYVKLRIAPTQLNEAAVRTGLKLVQECRDGGFVVQSWRKEAR